MYFYCKYEIKLFFIIVDNVYIFEYSLFPVIVDTSSTSCAQAAFIFGSSAVTRSYDIKVSFKHPFAIGSLLSFYCHFFVTQNIGGA